MNVLIDNIKANSFQLLGMEPRNWIYVPFSYREQADVSILEHIQREEYYRNSIQIHIFKEITANVISALIREHIENCAGEWTFYEDWRFNYHETLLGDINASNAFAFLYPINNPVVI
jgi:hypothetical protein